MNTTSNDSLGAPASTSASSQTEANGFTLSGHDIVATISLPLSQSEDNPFRRVLREGVDKMVGEGSAQPISDAYMDGYVMGLAAWTFMHHYEGETSSFCDLRHNRGMERMAGLTMFKQMMNTHAVISANPVSFLSWCAEDWKLLFDETLFNIQEYNIHFRKDCLVDPSQFGEKESQLTQLLDEVERRRRYACGVGPLKSPKFSDQARDALISLSRDENATRPLGKMWRSRQKEEGRDLTSDAEGNFDAATLDHIISFLEWDKEDGTALPQDFCDPGSPDGLQELAGMELIEGVMAINPAIKERPHLLFSTFTSGKLDWNFADWTWRDWSRQDPNESREARADRVEKQSSSVQRVKDALAQFRSERARHDRMLRSNGPTASTKAERGFRRI